jgi:hypothetical protein
MLVETVAQSLSQYRAPVGAGVGRNVARGVGTAVGAGVGAADGANVGATDGLGVGKGVGAVGDGVNTFALDYLRREKSIRRTLNSVLHWQF